MMKKIFIGFLLFGFICSALTTQVPDDTDDQNYQDDQDYDQQYDDQNESDESKNKVPIADLKGTLTSTEYSYSAKAGEKVELDCLKYLETDVKLENLVVFWTNETNGSMTLSNGAFVTGDQNRLEISKTQNLIINSVNQYDAGNYKCKPMGFNPELEVTAKLQVLAPPKVAILNNKRIVTGNTLDYTEHTRIDLNCVATGTPEPTIRWSVGGKLLTNVNGVETNGGNLLIKRASIHNAGDYQCLAENNDKQLDHGAITIRVNFSPRIRTHKPIVNSMEGNDRKLHCSYHSYPESKVVWEKNQHMLKSNEKYDIVQDKHHNGSVLVVKNINRSDLGVYQCKVQNIIGNAMSNVTLVFTPEPARFINTNVDGKHVLINWEIRSMLPLTDIILYYRKNGETPWAKETEVGHTRNETHGVYHVSHKLRLEPGVWETRVKSKNREGESAMSEAEQFTVHTVIDLDLDDGETQSDTRDNGGSPLGSSIILIGGLEIVRRLLFTYHHQN